MFHRSAVRQQGECEAYQPFEAEETDEISRSLPMDERKWMNAFCQADFGVEVNW